VGAVPQLRSGHPLGIAWTTPWLFFYLAHIPMSFSELGLSEELVRAVREAGYEIPTPIQLQAIPLVLKGVDLFAGAQTGTGKTAGFALPILERLKASPAPSRAPRALVLAPTRELAAQIDASFRVYGKHLKIVSTAVFGGVGINPQIAQLRRGVDIVVATPGRLLDLAQQKAIDLSGIQTVVLDEADRMLDMGFIHDITRVLALLPKKRQSLLFSATFSDEIKALAAKFLSNPQSVEATRRNSTVEVIEQVAHPVDRERKRELLQLLIEQHNWFQVLVFTRTKHGANRLAEQLDKAGISSLAIHGNKSQGARTRALSEFKSGSLRVLVATYIAPRRIHNNELPVVAEDYIHRIGRTGRAGASGNAVSLVCIDEKGLLHDIERLIKREIKSVPIEGFEPDPRIKAEPLQKPRTGGGGRGRPQAGNGGGNSRHAAPERSGRATGQKQAAPAKAKPAGSADGRKAAHPAVPRAPSPTRRFGPR
jgi:ATP-dependent RNA helicase RhlE